MNAMTKQMALAAAAGLACATMAFAQNTPEIEPNETKAQATAVLAPMAAGHTLTGNTTGTSTTVAGAASADTFRVKTVVDSPGIYRYRLVLTTTGTAGHIGTIRGLNQVAAAQAVWAGVIGTAGVTDTTIQTSSTTTTPARFNQWYGFGKGEELYYRVTGVATTTADFTATLERLAVTPTSIAGSFAPGFVTLTTLTQGHTTDTELFVYDSNFSPIAGYSNDDEAVAAISGVPGALGTTLQSVLRRNYAAGTYYVAVANFNSCNNLASPSDDDFRTGALMDFPDVLTNTSTTVNLNTAFSISDGVTTTSVPNTRVGAFDVNWFKFTVGTPPPACYADCDGVGGLTANDFICFVTSFNNGGSYADCDGVGGLTANDFICFVTAYNTGCS